MNPVLKNLLESLNASIGLIAQTPCVIVGSTSAIDYLDTNQNNPHCPINTFLKLKEAERVCISVPPDHAKMMIDAVNNIELETTYNLTNSPSLFNLFQQLLSESAYRLKITVKKANKQVISVKSGIPNIDALALETLNDAQVGYELGVMAESSFHAQKEQQPYTFIEFKGERSLAYSCQRYASAAIEILEWNILPIIEDTFSKKTSITEENISKVVGLINEANERNSPIIIPLPKSYNDGRAMYATVYELLNDKSIDIATLNSQQFAYQGETLVSVAMSDPSCVKECLPNTPTLFGNITTVDDIKVVEHCLENMIQVVAFTKLPIEQLPSSYKPFIKQVTQ